MIGQTIRNNGFSTHVGADVVCASGCAFIWIAGVPRYVGENAHLGFHGAFDYNKKTTSDGNAVLGAYLSGLGFSYGTIARLTAPSPDDMLWMTTELSTELGITWAWESEMKNPPVARNDPPVDNRSIDWSQYGTWIQIASRSNLSQAREIATQMRAENPDISDYINIFTSSNGYYAVAFGPVRTDAHKILSSWFSTGGIVPSDSFVTSGRHYDKLIDGGRKIPTS
jgi:hypothetical protein